MNLNAIMDDFDAKLRLEQTDRKPKNLSLDETRRIVIKVGSESTLRLVAPILGHDFLSGFEETTTNWIILHSSNIEDVRFESCKDHDLPKLRRRDLGFIDFLKELPMPVAVQLQLADMRVINAPLTQVEGDFLFLEASRALSVRSLRAIRMLEATDQNQLQEWRTN